MATDMAQERVKREIEFRKAIRQYAFWLLPDDDSFERLQSCVNIRSAQHLHLFEISCTVDILALNRLANETVTAISKATTPLFMSAWSALQTPPQEEMFEEFRRLLPASAETFIDILSTTLAQTATQAPASKLDRLRPRSEDPEAVLEITTRMKEEISTVVKKLLHEYVNQLRDALHHPIVQFTIAPGCSEQYEFVEKTTLRLVQVAEDCLNL